MPGAPRRRPYPFDMLVDGHGVMLGQAKKGAGLVATRPTTLDQVAPTTFEYGAQSPIAERIQVWDDLTLGFGLYKQEAFTDRKSRNTIGADLSIGGVMQKGPAITEFAAATRDTTNGVSNLFEIGGSVYSLNGRYVHKRANDASWTQEKDFGVGKAATDVVVFATNATGTTYAYVAMGDAEFMYRFDGTTWTQHASLYARNFVVVAKEIYRAHDTNMLAKCDSDADPWTAGNWSAVNSFRVGDKSSGITRLATTSANQLVAMKTDGIYTLESDGQDRELFPFLNWAPEAENGKYTWAFVNDLHTSFGKSHSRLVQNGTALQLQPMGPERLVENNSPVKGRVTAGVAVGHLFALAGIYDDDTGDSYLLKFGGYLTPSIAEGRLQEAQRLDSWNGSISQVFDSKKITAAFVSSVGADSGHTRTYLGFSDGYVAWLQNPCTANPAACSNYDFSSADGEVYFPLWHGGFQADPKTLRALSVMGTLTATSYAQFEYKLAHTDASYTALGTNFDATPRTKVEFPDNTSTTLADFKLILKGTAPLVTAVALHHAVRPYLVLMYEFMVMAADGLIRRDGTFMRAGAEAIRSWIKSAAEGPGSTAFVLPDQTQQQLSIVDYSETIAWDERLRGWRAAIGVKAIQLKTNTTFGTVERLGSYSVGDLAPFSIEQLGDL